METPELLAEDILWFNSLAYKRAGRWEEALRIWQGLAESESREGFLAGIELAKYFEHKQRDIETAYRHASRAKLVCPPVRTHQDQLAYRLERLKRRLKD